MNDIYLEVREALFSQLVNYLNTSDERVDVYKSNFQSIPMFPAVTLQLVARNKAHRGNQIYELTLNMNVCVYTDVLVVEDAEADCYRLTEVVEEAIISDQTLGGVVANVTLTGDDIEFGTVEIGEANFLQGARIPIKIRKLYEGRRC